MSLHRVQLVGFLHELLATGRLGLYLVQLSQLAKEEGLSDMFSLYVCLLNLMLYLWL